MFVPYIRFPNITLSRMAKGLARPRECSPSKGKETTPRVPGGIENTVKRDVDYPTRLAVCAAASFLGLQLLAWHDNLVIRMLGIALASLSSNLGDM
jgi:hypothetical protein